MFSFTPGRSHSFNGNSDTLQFDNGVSAKDVSITSLSNNSTLLTTNSGSMTLTGMPMNQIGGNNIRFQDGSELLIGDNSTGGSNDSAGNSLAGSDQNDRIYGMGGADHLAGGAGNDIMFGGTGVSDSTDGADTMDGGAGNDVMYANAGNDSITGTAGMDTVFAGAGNDRIDYGHCTERENLFGGGGRDSITGSGAADTIYGGSGVSDSTDSADTINGGSGADLIYANAGNDSISGVSGADTIFAGAGDDTIDYSSNSVAVRIFGGGGSDTITGGSGADIIIGGNGITDSLDGADSINGGAGNDQIFANAGNDTVNGGAGNDTILSGLGVDSLTGGDGNDTFFINVNTANTGGTWASADTITDFVTGADVLELDVAGSRTNYRETDGSSYISESDVLTAARAALNGTVKYFFAYNVNDTGNGYLYYDANGTDGGETVIILTGANSASFLADNGADIVV